MGTNFFSSRCDWTVFYVHKPTWANITELREQEEQFIFAQQKADRVSDIRNKIVTSFNNIEKTDLDRLQKFLPVGVDSGKLILDIDTIAQKYGARLDELDSSFDQNKEELLYESFTLSFIIETTYSDFVSFLHDIEKSLQLMEVTSVEIKVDENTGVANYGVDITIYSFNQ